MNPVLQDIEREGTVLMPSGARAPLHSGVTPDAARVLRRAVEASAPRLACEVGLAFGISTLHILDAMREFGGGHLIGMDPAQHDHTWQGAGLHNIERAGYSGNYTFHAATSQLLLPRLAGEGTRIQFAFIDGWHTFDHALVDFFYLDMMMDVGGVMVLDDVWGPGLQRLAHFIVSNRAYSYLDGASRPMPSGWRPSLKSIMRSALHPLVRDNLTPTHEVRRLEAPIDRCQLVALRKDGDDRRPFDHFVPF